MENSTQYEKYKPAYKKACIFKAAAGASAVIAILFFLFVPFFLIRTEFEGIVFDEYSFSLFDEIKNSLQSLKSGLDGEASFTFVLSIYQILAVIFLCVGVIMMVYSLIKNITAVLNTENYAIEEYDKVKKGGDKRKGWRRFSPTNCIVTAVVLEIIYIIMVKNIFSAFGVDTENNEVSEIVGSRFISCNAVSWTILFCIIFFALFIVLSLLSYNISKKVKTSILKEDYGANRAA